MSFKNQTKAVLFIGFTLVASFVHAQGDCNDPFASNFNAAEDCTYCTPSNVLDSAPLRNSRLVQACPTTT